MCYFTLRAVLFCMVNIFILFLSNICIAHIDLLLLYVTLIFIPSFMLTMSFKWHKTKFRLYRSAFCRRVGVTLKGLIMCFVYNKELVDLCRPTLTWPDILYLDKVYKDLWHSSISLLHLWFTSTTRYLLSLS